MKSKTAWIVDDDPVYQKFIKNFLVKAGYEVVDFSTGEESLENLHLSPDLIILDHDLGNGINGLETLQKLKKMKPKVPIVYLSAHEELSYMMNVYNLGSFDYIVKNNAAPLRINNNLEKIENLNQSIIQNHRKYVQRLLYFGITAIVTLVGLIVYFTWS